MIETNLESLLAEATGSTFPNVSGQQLKNLKIAIPTLKSQYKISEILSSLDDKIELNREMNKTLEELAQVMFKEWFVYFNFPGATGEMVESEMGMIPKGWKVGRLKEEVNIVMGQSPSGESYNQTGEGIIFFQGKAEFGFRFPTIDKYTTEPKKFANKNDILLSVRAPVGTLNVAFEKCCIGRGLAAISSNKSCPSYTLYLLQGLSEVFEKFNGEGTVFGTINQTDLGNIPIIIPDNNSRSAFENQSKAFNGMILNNEIELQNLIQTRNFLLPKLMKGEIILTA